MLDNIRDLFGRRRKTLDDLPLDELHKERIRLDQEEQKLLLRLDEMEEEKKKLFTQGKNEPSERKRMALARKFTEVDVQAHAMERNMQYFSKQLRIVNGFMDLKENQRILKESGLASIISRMDLQELQIYVDQATIDGTFQFEKLREVLDTLEGGRSIAGDIRDDREVMEVFRLMQAASEADDEEPLDSWLKQANSSALSLESNEKERV